MPAYIKPETPKPTEADIDRHFDAAKAICKTMLPLTARAQARILRYFLDIIDERGDMREEYEILAKVSKQLGIAP